MYQPSYLDIDHPGQLLDPAMKNMITNSLTMKKTSNLLSRMSPCLMQVWYCPFLLSGRLVTTIPPTLSILACSRPLAMNLTIRQFMTTNSYMTTSPYLHSSVSMYSSVTPKASAI